MLILEFMMAIRPAITSVMIEIFTMSIEIVVSGSSIIITVRIFVIA